MITYQQYLRENSEKLARLEKARRGWVKIVLRRKIEDGTLTKGRLKRLSDMGLDKEQQEYAIQHRPDLIDSITNLDPDLAKKYKHEQELGKVDL